MAAVKPIPEGYHSVTPFLMVAGAAKVIEFAKSVFNAREIERVEGPGGAIMHAEVQIGDSRVMIADAGGEWKSMPGTLYVYVTDMDAAYQRALKAGGASRQAPVDQFYGDRNAGVEDPAGNVWWIATHKEDVTADELKRRMASMQTRAAG